MLKVLAEEILKHEIMPLFRDGCAGSMEAEVQ
jgi:hypothetical protein